MAEKRNPWLPEPEEKHDETVQVIASDDELPPLKGPQVPQPHSVERPATVLPTVNYSVEAPLWFVGAHGGSGETTLASLVDEWEAAEHCWPVSSEKTNRVVLVARSSFYGLRSAQSVLEQWASGGVAETVDVIGLVLIADSPGTLPRPLRELAHVVSGGAARTWWLPWVEQWRVDDPTSVNRPRAVRKLIKDLSAITDETKKPLTERN